MSKRRIKCEVSQRSKRSKTSIKDTLPHNVLARDESKKLYTFEDAARDAQAAESRGDDEPNSFVLRFQNKALVAALFDYRRRLKISRKEGSLSSLQCSESIVCLSFVERKWQQLGFDLGEILQRYLGETDKGGCDEGSDILDAMITSLPEQEICAIVSDNDNDEDEGEMSLATLTADDATVGVRKAKLAAFEARIEEMSVFTKDLLTRVCCSLTDSSVKTDRVGDLRKKRQKNAVVQVLRSKQRLLKKEVQDLQTRLRQVEKDRHRAQRIAHKRRALITAPEEGTDGASNGVGRANGRAKKGESSAAVARNGVAMAADASDADTQAIACRLQDAQTQCKMRLAEIAALRRELTVSKQKCVQAANKAAAVLPPHLQQQQSATEELAQVKLRYQRLFQTRQAQIDVNRRESNERAETLQITLDDTRQAIHKSLAEHEADRQRWNKDRRALVRAVADVKKVMKENECVQKMLKELEAIHEALKKKHAADRVPLLQQLAAVKLAAEKSKASAFAASGGDASSELAVRCEGLKVQLKQATAANEELYTEIESIGGAFEEMQEQSEKLLHRVQKLDKEAATFREKKIRAEEKLMDLQDQQIALERVRLAQKAVIKQTGEVLIAKEEQETLLRAELAQSKDLSGRQRETIEGLGSQFREAQSKTTVALAHLDAARKRNVTLTDNISASEDTVQELRSQCKRLEENNANLKRRCNRSWKKSPPTGSYSSKSSKPKTTLDYMCDVTNSHEELKDVVKMKFGHLYCSVCESNLKDTVITKCFHSFCRDCVEKNLSTRHRKCATCGVSFGATDVRKVY